MNIIDFEKDDDNKILNKLKICCKNDGIFYIKNFGLSMDYINGILKFHEKFFNTINNDIEFRNNIEGEFINNNPVNKGYYKYDTCKEDYQYWSELPPESKYSYPNKLTLNYKFNKIIKEYHENMINLGKKILEYIALSLDFEKTYFENIILNPIIVTRFIKYNKSNDKGFACNAHKDYGLITILVNDKSGLEIYDEKNEEWSKFNSIQDCLIVNLGKIMEIITNNKYRAVYHRVTYDSWDERKAIAFFLEPSYNFKFMNITYEDFYKKQVYENEND